MLCFLCKVRGCSTIKGKGASLVLNDLRETSEIVHAALQELATLYNSVKSGEVTGVAVEHFRKETDQLQILYEAANIGNALLAPQFAEFSSALQVCVDIIKAVKMYRLKLVVVVDYCTRISKGMQYFYLS